MPTLPNQFHTFFCGDDLSQLNWDDHKIYITKTIMEKGNLEAVRWLRSSADISTLRDALQTKIDPVTKRFWEVVLS
jgi:hypothetical protein